MKNFELLNENKAKRVTQSVPRLILFSLFCTWQMGVIYFNTGSVSLKGKERLPFDNSGLIIVLAVGYIVSAVLLTLFTNKAVVFSRFLLPISFVCTAALLFPFSAKILAVLFAVEAFVCVLMTGFTLCTIALWFTFETEVTDVIVTLIVSGLVTAVLQNDLFIFSFKVFNIVSVVIQAGLIYFFFTFNPDEGIRFASRKEHVTSPSKLNAGIYLLVIASCILLCFGASFTESVKNGVTIYYLAGALCAAVIVIFLQKKKVNLISIATIFVSVSAIGFLLSAGASFYPSLAVPACILLGAGMVVCALTSIFGLIIFTRNASRYVPALLMLSGMVIALLQSFIFERFGDDHYTRYLICAAVAVFTALLYLSLSPYLIYAYKKESRITSDVKHHKPIKAKSPLDLLSGQEKRLSELILSGYSGSEIAELMNITLGTMKNYRINLYQKLCIHSRRELFAIFEEIDNEGN